MKDETCIKKSISGKMAFEFEWINKSIYKGKKQFKNFNLDIWEFNIGYSIISLGVSREDPNRPVWMRRITPTKEINIEFISFNETNKISERWFNIPDLCENISILINENIIDCVSRSSMINSAQSWVNAHVPYNQGATYGGYREDCSGYVSMCWETSKPGYTTYTLPQISHPISQSELQPGDILLCTTEHVVLFGGWTSGGQYIAFEETRPGEGTVRRSTPYPYWYNTGCFKPYRFNSVC